MYSTKKQKILFEQKGFLLNFINIYTLSSV